MPTVRVGAGPKPGPWKGADTMRLLEIELQNFRSYEHETISFSDPRTLLIGENGTGKSTLIDAVAWGLLGRCRGVDGRGQGQKDLIRIGAAQAQVRVKTDVLTITRTISRSGSVSATMKTESVLADLGVTEAMLAAVIYGRHFFTLHHSEAKALLMQLLDVTIPLAQLPPFLAKHYTGPLTLDDATAAYDAAFRDRAGLKKALAAVLVPDVAARPDLDGLATVPLQLGIQEARKAYQKAVTDLAGAETRRDTAAQALAKAKQLAGNVDRLKGSLEAHQGMLKEAEQALADAKVALAAAEAEPAEPVDQLKAESNRITLTVQQVEGANSGAPAEGQRPCVLSDRIPCLTPVKEFKGAVAQLKKDVKALADRIKAGTKRAADLATAQAQARTCDRQLAYHQDQVAKLQAQVDEAQAQADQVTNLELQAIQAAQAVPQFQEPVAKAQADQDRLVKQQTDLAGYTAQLKGQERAKAEVANLQQQLTEAEALVDLLGPKGLPAKALGQAVGDFEAAVNAALAAFGFSLTVQPEPWGVFVRTPDVGQPVPFDLLSAGEQLWTGLAFQLALAAISGLDFCCLDAAESVVGRRRGILTGLVMGAPVGQVVVAMAKAADEAAPEIAGLQVVRMKAPMMA